MSRAQILDMLKRQAAYDARGSALVGGVLPGYEPMIAAAGLIGGARKKKTPGRNAKGQFTKGHKGTATHGRCAPGQLKKGKSGKLRCHKFLPIGGGCGMCGACGGVLEVAPPTSKEARDAKQQFLLDAEAVSANLCPPYDVLFDGPGAMDEKEQAAYYAQMADLAKQVRNPEFVVNAWRNRTGAKTQENEALRKVGRLLGVPG